MTSTSSFGASRRERHDASAFYRRGLAAAAFSSDDELAAVPEAVLDRVHLHSAEAMSELPDNSVGLMVTSPPYHVGKDYDGDGSFEEYLGMLERVFAEVHRVLEPGGRAAVNVANLGRRPYLPLSHRVGAIMDELGFHMRGEIIWRKARGASSSCAFGTWLSARNPVLRDVHEYVLVYSKGRMGRVRTGTSTIGRDEFLRDTLSVWEIPAESAQRVGHPAPFPVELPRRLIELFTFTGDVVLDPFMGSGSTAVAAVATGRRFVGYEIDAGYVDLAKERLQAERQAQAAKGQRSPPPGASSTSASPSPSSMPAAEHRPSSSSTATQA